MGTSSSAAGPLVARPARAGHVGLATLAALAALATLGALGGCGGTPYGRADARVEMERLSAALEAQQAEIRRLVSKITVLERRLGARPGGRAPLSRPAAPGAAREPRKARPAGRDVRGGRRAVSRPVAPGPASSGAPAGAATGAAGDPSRSSSSASPPSTATSRPAAGGTSASPRGPTSDVKFTRQVQEALKLAGLDPGPVDGRMGPRTAAALRQFQQENNLPETGTASPDTWARLKRYLPDSGRP